MLLDVPGRIARLLLDLAEESGTNAIEKTLTHQTIAQMIGASRETVSRAMKDFQDANWVSVIRRKISLTDRPALRLRFGELLPPTVPRALRNVAPTVSLER